MISPQDRRKAIELVNEAVAQAGRTQIRLASYPDFICKF